MEMKPFHFVSSHEAILLDWSHFHKQVHHCQWWLKTKQMFFSSCKSSFDTISKLRLPFLYWLAIFQRMELWFGCYLTLMRWFHFPGFSLFMDVIIDTILKSLIYEMFVCFFLLCCNTKVLVWQMKLESFIWVVCSFHWCSWRELFVSCVTSTSIPIPHQKSP